VSLYKRGKVWWVKLYRDGVPTYKSTKTADKVEAKRKHDAWTGEIAKGEFLPRQDQVRYEELVEDLVRHYENTGDRDLVEVNTRLKHLTRFFQGMRAAKIDGPTVARYVTSRKGEGANGTINRELGLLVKVLRLGLRNRKLVYLPAIDKLKEAAPRQGFFEDAHYEAVRRLLPEDVQVALTIAHTYGWRTQSEVLTLERRQLDLEAGTLRLDPGTTKNDDGRVVYLTPELKALLSAQVERVKALEKKLERIIPHLFPHLSGSHVKVPRRPVLGERRQDFKRAWKTACRKAGVPGALRHDFRRTAVRNMVNEGVPERVAMKVTGHKTRSVFDRYHIVSPADLKEASRKISQRTEATR
jgi:integrase